MAFYRLLRLGELADFDRRVIRVAGRELLIIGASPEPVVVDNQCPHQGFPLAQGALDEHSITCPRHGFRFRLTSGESLEAPACRLTRYRVGYDGQWLGVELD